ncbi:MAG: ABC transporter substrate-binding protein [Armatimonadota bacterium]
MKGFRFGLVALLLLAPALVFAGGQGEAESVQEEGQQTEVSGDTATEVVDPAIPASWNEAPKTASEMGIGSFRESPFLDGRDLPPVADRLPDDPPVIEPYESVGKYGGDFITWGLELESDFHRGTLSASGPGPMAPTASGTDVIPWFLESFEYNDDHSELTAHFREGLKWSDGTPYVAGDEWSFWWEHYATNTEDFDHDVRRHPTLGLQDMRVVDDNTVVFVHNEATPFHKLGFGNFGLEAWVGPAHFMRDYFPSAVGEEQALANAEELGFDNYIEAIEDLSGESLHPSEPDYGVPTLRPWMAVSRSETRLVLERNPYYAFVDTEGNQLPYVDRIVVNLASRRDNAEIQATTGNASVAYESLSAENIPLYKANEEKEAYRTLIYTSAATARPYYMFNFFAADEELAEVFQNVDFRRAMSLAIDRQEINDRFYYGFGNPIQVTAPATSPLFREEFARSYAEYDPERARELLDEIGLTDSDGDGVRELPNGRPLKFEIMYTDAVFLQPVTLHELVASFWEEVGVDATIDSVGGSSFWQRRGTPDFEVSPHIMDAAVPFMAAGFFDKGFAPTRGAGSAPHWAWGDWIISDGDQGIEPPQEQKDLVDAALRWSQEGDEEAGLELMRSMAENLWVIGTVANPPQPVIIADNLRNVPEFMLFEHQLGRMTVARPEQWYFD